MAAFRFNFGGAPAPPVAPAGAGGGAGGGRGGGAGAEAEAAAELPEAEAVPWARPARGATWEAVAVAGGGGGGGGGLGGPPLELEKVVPPAGAEAAGGLGARGSSQRSDLVAGVYEGGFKAWECGTDLARYVWARHGGAASGGRGQGGGLRGRRVLELGCGHGLPGLAAVRLGAAVDFQDYNREVILQATQPNVRRNLAVWGEVEREGETGFFAGPWSRLRELLPGGAYDAVLTAETIYDPAGHGALLDLVRHCLRPGGAALVATKAHYFGVGGGAAAFRLAAEERGWVCSTVEEWDDGCSNMRCVLRLDRRGGGSAPPVF